MRLPASRFSVPGDSTLPLPSVTGVALSEIRPSGARTTPPWLMVLALTNRPPAADSGTACAPPEDANVTVIGAPPAAATSLMANCVAVTGYSCAAVKVSAATVLNAPSNCGLPGTFTAGGLAMTFAPATRRMSPPLWKSPEAKPDQPLMPRMSISCALTTSKVAVPVTGCSTVAALAPGKAGSK
ncbi:MAG: hypothetical protein WDO12_07515 [Pseudomonadota bacterium]